MYDARKDILGRGVDVNGSHCGFFFTCLDDGQAEVVLLRSNTTGESDGRSLMRGLERMVTGGR